LKDFGFRPVFEDFWQVWGLSFLQEHKKRRTRESKTPHAEMPNAARGNCNPRTRRLKSPYRELKITTCRFCNYSVSLLLLHQADVPTGEEQLLPNLDAKVARQDFVRPVVRAVSHAIEQGMRQAVQSSK